LPRDTIEDSRSPSGPHLRPRRQQFRAVRPAVLAAALGVGALVLGFLGWRNVSQSGSSAFDDLYRSLQLFAFEWTNPEGKVPWTLDVARFLAPLAVAYSAVATFLALARDRSQRAYVRAFARRHFVVIGLGGTGGVVAESLRRPARTAQEKGRRWPWRRAPQVVVIESDPRNTRIPATRAAGVRVIVGDATDRTICEAARVSRARQVIVLTGDDSINLEVLAVSLELLGDAAESVLPTFHVAISDVSLWKELGRLQLEGRRRGAWTEFFNIPDRTGQTLVEEATGQLGHAALRRVRLEGEGVIPVRLAVHLIRRAVHVGLSPIIELPKGSRLADQLRESAPDCFHAACFEEVLPEEAPSLAAVPAAVFVCGQITDAAGVARGVALTRELPGAHVFVAVYAERRSSMLDVVGVGHERLHLVAAKVTALTTQLLQGSGIERLARARHEDYVRLERERGVDQEANPSLVRWEELPETLKESNRRFAESVGGAVAKLGATLQPLRRSDSVGDAPIPPDRLEQLGRAEHDRWMRVLKEAGWTHTSGPKDAAAKQHPLLVPWEELSEAEREKDRDGYRSLPRLLATLGYELHIDSNAPAST